MGAEDPTVGLSGAVVLLSGGVDSSTLLHDLCRRGGLTCVHALSFSYRQRHSRELAAARAQAAAAGVTLHRIVDIGVLGELVQSGTTLTTGSAPVPDLADVAPGELCQPPTYVPNRNMVLLSLASAYAESVGIPHVFYGAQAQDRYGYWDCTTEFLGRMNALLALNRKGAVRIHAPYVALRKAEIVRLGFRLGVDFSRTWTCYRGDERPCGACPSCVERMHAFREAGIEDPLVAG